LRFVLPGRVWGFIFNFLVGTKKDKKTDLHLLFRYMKVWVFCFYGEGVFFGKAKYFLWKCCGGADSEIFALQMLWLCSLLVSWLSQIFHLDTKAHLVCVADSEIFALQILGRLYYKSFLLLLREASLNIC